MLSWAGTYPSPDNRGNVDSYPFHWNVAIDRELVTILESGMDNFIAMAQRELEQLEAEVRADPRHEKIRRLRELLAVYEPPQLGEAHYPRPAVQPFVPKPTAGAPSKAKAMEAAIGGLLREKGHVHRSVILKHLIDREIMGHEKSPMTRLAIFLSARRHLYASDGKGNFRLKFTRGSDREAAE